MIPVLKDFPGLIFLKVESIPIEMARSIISMWVPWWVDGLYEVSATSKKQILNMKDHFDSYQRSNDAKCDPCGRLWFGSSSFNEDLGVGGDLYLYDQGEVTKVIPNTKIANGMAWSSDGRTFYWADSLDNAVYAFDYSLESGHISNRRVLFEIKDAVPDGMCIDSNNNLWVAVWGGHRVENRDGRTGELLGVVQVEASNVTCCCFGGDNMDELFITTSGDGQNGENDGCVFRCKPGVKGPSIVYFGGDRYEA